jgi:hypothetical protein
MPLSLGLITLTGFTAHSFPIVTTVTAELKLGRKSPEENWYI